MTGRPLILIPVHNRRATSLACLDRLAANGDLKNFEVRVIDDGSTDGTCREIARHHPEVAIDSGDGELFWGGAIAAGMRSALRAGTRPLFWLNDDCLPLSGTLPALAALLHADPNTIVVPRCVMAESGSAWPNAFVGRRRVAGRVGETLRVDGASGYCVGIGSGVLKALGPVDAVHFPHYGADTAYTLRATKAGFSVLLVGSLEAHLVKPGRKFHCIADHIDPHASLSTNARRIFFSKKSPFRIRTVLGVHRLKHGAILGSVEAGLKVAKWFAYLSFLRLRAGQPRSTELSGQ